MGIGRCCLQVAGLSLVLVSASCLAREATAQADLQVLESRIQHRFDVLDRLKKEASFVRRIERSLRHHDRDGSMTLDVLLVDTLAGPMAMKVYKPEHLEEPLAMSLVLNEYLGELGIAPKLYGYLPHAEVAGILGTRGELTDESFSFAVLLELIEDAWNIRDAFTYVPPQLRAWSLEAVVERIEYFEETLDTLRVKANDTQYFISGAGRIYLFDFDHFNWISRDNELWGYPAPFTIQEEDFASLKAEYGTEPILVRNDFSFDIQFLQQVFAENQQKTSP